MGATAIHSLEAFVPSRPGRINYYSIGYDCLTLAEAMDEIDIACREKRRLHVVTANVSFVRLASTYPLFREVVSQAEMVTVDGRILQWLTWLYGKPAPQQITGHDLFQESVNLARQRGYRIFLLGGLPGAAKKVADRLKQKSPDLQIEGTNHGKFSSSGIPEREEELNQVLQEYRPDILFVSLGSPKQEYWLARSFRKLEIPVAVGVGAVIDVAAGLIPKAPRWISKAGLETPFRILTSPGRYARRYFLQDLPMLMKLLVFSMRERKKQQGLI